MGGIRSWLGGLELLREFAVKPDLSKLRPRLRRLLTLALAKR
jgi:hypothetical protein